MNKKKLYIIAALVIVFAVIAGKKYITFNDFPSFDKWEGMADEIVISKEKKEVKLFNKDGKWFVSDKLFPADQQKCIGLNKKLTEIVFNEQISEKENYDRYDLGDDKAAHVTVKKSGKTVRDISFGKPGSVSQQLYMKVGGVKGVFLVSGINPGDYVGDEGVFRDKTIISITKESIKNLTVKSRGASYTLELIEKITQPDAVPAAKDAKKGAKTDVKKTQPIKSYEWKAANVAIVLDQAKADSLASGIIHLVADSYPDIETYNKAPQCTVTVKAAGKDITLEIFDKDKTTNTYLCKSSETKYYFNIYADKAEKFMKPITELKAADRK